MCSRMENGHLIRLDHGHFHTTARALPAGSSTWGIHFLMARVRQGSSLGHRYISRNGRRAPSSRCCQTTRQIQVGAGSHGVRTSGVRCWCLLPLSQERAARSTSPYVPAQEIRVAYLQQVWHRTLTTIMANGTHCSTGGPIVAQWQW